MAVWVVVLIICIVASLPPICYLWIQFWKLRNHFIVKARFPYITLIASVSMFISGFSDCAIMLVIYFSGLMTESREEFYTSTNLPLSYYILISIANVSAFAFCVLIVWRTLLLYDLWKMCHVTLDNKNDIILSMDLYHTEHYATYKLCGFSFVFHNSTWILPLGILFLLLFINVAICAPLSSSDDLIYVVPAYSFMLSWIAIIVLGIIIIFRARKVTEYIHLLRETYFIVIIVLLQIFLNPVENMFEVHVSFVFDAVLAIGSSFLVICIALWMVYKNEGSMQRPHLDTTVSVSIATRDSTSKPKIFKLKRLYRYLNEGEENYNEFADFLTKCFALENLLFFVKAVVFRQVVVDLVHDEKTKHTKEDHKNDSGHITISENTNNEDADDKEDKLERGSMDIFCPTGVWQKIFWIDFKYVNGLRDSCMPKKDRLVYAIAKNIYHQYIAENAVNQVNISGESRKELELFFEGDSDRKMQQYLKVFNGAIQEVYENLDCIYRFQYKAISKLKE